MTLTLFLDFKKVFAVIVFIQFGLMSGKNSAQPMSTSIITARARTRRMMTLFFTFKSV
jgi:hypothetical protein